MAKIKTSIRWLKTRKGRLYISRDDLVSYFHELNTRSDGNFTTTGKDIIVWLATNFTDDKLK